MGMHEYDRIRAKNRVHQVAYDFTCYLRKDKGMSDSDIEAHIKDLLKLTDTTNPRNNIYEAVLNIVRRSNDNKELSVHCNNGRISNSD